MKSGLTRVLSGVVFGVIVACGTLVLPPLFHILALAAIIVTMHEFYSMTLGPKALRPERILTVTSALVFYLLLTMLQMGRLDSGWWLLLSAVSLLVAAALPLWSANEGCKGMGYVLAGLFYTGIPLAIQPLILFHGSGREDGVLMLCLLCIVWAGDIGAFLLGSALGSRPGAIKIAPRVSPHKSLWGLAGSIVCCIALSLALHSFIGLEKTWESVLLGLIASLGGLLGDLIESLWKRSFGLKDSGKIMPGHGGLYDRLDSVIVALPLMGAYLLLLGVFD